VNVAVDGVVGEGETDMGEVVAAVTVMVVVSGLAGTICGVCCGTTCETVCVVVMGCCGTICCVVGVRAVVGRCVTIVCTGRAAVYAVATSGADCVSCARMRAGVPAGDVVIGVVCF
jgi:hypothetical protein